MTRGDTLHVLVQVGTRGRVWHIVNEHGGLIEVFIGTRAAAERRARELMRHITN